MRLEHRIAGTVSLRSAKALAAFGLTLFLLPCSLALNAQSTPAPSSPQPAGTKPPMRVRTQMEGFDLSPKSGKGANQIGGASRDLGTPKLFAPNSGLAFNTNPEFHWAAPEVGAKVTFRLTTLDGQTLFEEPTTADHLRYPGDAPALTPGASYRWTIVPENDILGGPPQPVTFTIVSGEKREAILNDLKAANDASSTAQVFVKHRIWYDAIQTYSDLVASMPNDTAARSSRAQLYDQLPVTKSLADADWRMIH
jgi:hypothetical protein